MSIEDGALAIAAAEAGAAVVRSRYGTVIPRFQKAPLDFATAADLESEQVIVDLLRAARPADAVIGEETGLTGADTVDQTWLVDPLCGTLNFAARTPLVAVNVALRTGADVTVAAQADPFAREVFWTDGGPAHVRRDGVDELLRPSADSLLVDVNLDAPLPNSSAFQPARLLTDPEFTARFRARVVSTSLAVAWVADGRRAAYVTDGHIQDSVHFASGIAVCRAAGCVVTGLRGQPLHTGGGGLLVAADQDTHRALLAVVERQFGSPARP
ncbi:inositol monophosphatase family protein [Micromonospora sp. WMMD882]|uniref:inositol monophosphatase family protein n=1 Tax=Micromonospora sp. WMMD882 TaxID=3015151 RepID=UPI00248C8EF3|nr:inositol monophosphatase family protein [Micromonospora sp. WMMD882]WBB79661.1 inositol monophosphatase family protein [Micromonospora sp. WMMD882]